MSKQYKLRPEDIRPLAPGRGGCIATDGIVVDGRRVGVMIREATERPNDSGWRFEGAGESPEELADPSRWAVYDVNTIANCDPAIVEHLDLPPPAVCLLDSDGVLKVAPPPAAAFFLKR